MEMKLLQVFDQMIYSVLYYLASVFAMFSSSTLYYLSIILAAMDGCLVSNSQLSNFKSRNHIFDQQ